MNKRTKLSVTLAVIMAALQGCAPSSPGFNPAMPPLGPLGQPQTGGGGGAPSGCLTINQRIPFNASNIHVDSYNVMGGRLPSSGTTIGTVSVGGATGTVNYSGQSNDGLLQMGFQVANQQYNATGVLMISTLTQQDILQQAGSGNAQLCVTGIAFDLGFDGNNQLYDFVYLYFNNTTNGYTLIF